MIVSVVLLGLFALSLPFVAAPRLRRRRGRARPGHEAPALADLAGDRRCWPSPALLAAFVSDWFVVALEPTMDSLGISEAFAGLVIVAIAGNAVENVVGIQLAAAGKSQYAFSIVLNSPIQIALVLAPVLVIVSPDLRAGDAHAGAAARCSSVSLLLAIILAAFIAFDGESTWLEGASLVALYGIIATSFWWG